LLDFVSQQPRKLYVVVIFASVTACGGSAAAGGLSCSEDAQVKALLTIRFTKKPLIGMNWHATPVHRAV